MLTLFTTAKPFRGHNAIIQRNAIQSWTRLQPACEIILFGDDEGAEETAAEFGLRFVPDVGRNQFGAPLVSDLFAKAQQLARHDLLCYLNADILLMSDFGEAVERIAGHKRDFLMVGQRWNVEIEQPLEFGSGWEGDLRRFVKQNGELASSWAIDYFAFSRGWLSEIPAFVVGRPGWDNWMLYAARSQRISVVDATRLVMAVHQNHEASWNNEQPESLPNLRLSQASTRGYHFSIKHATWVLTPRGLVPAVQKDYLRSRLEALPVFHPFLKTLARPVKRMVSLFRWGKQRSLL